MDLTYIGDPPSSFTAGDWPKPPFRYADQPTFAVDAQFVFGGRPLTVLEKTACRLIERSGRPSVRVGAINLHVDRQHLSNLLFIREFTAGEEAHYLTWLENRPRTSYRAIDCGIYDVVESLAVGAKPVGLTYLRGDGLPVSATARLITTKTDRSEEYVQVEDHGWIRLDRFRRLNGADVNADSQF
jgi:transcriptional antiterminator Rof (Rho-off)